MLFTLSQTESSYAPWLNFKIKKHKGRRKTFPDPGIESPTGLFAREQRDPEPWFSSIRLACSTGWNSDCWAPPPEFLIQWAWDGT